jgi:hypothetical protein
MFLSILMTVNYILEFLFDRTFRRREIEAMFLNGAVDEEDIKRRQRLLDQALRSSGRGF